MVPVVFAVMVLLLPVACSKPSSSSGKDTQAAHTVKPVQTEQVDQTRQKAEDYHVGRVRINPHPTSLEGKTIVLRWNGKFNGDKVLNRLAGLIAEKVPGVKIVKIWMEDPTTATTSYNPHNTIMFAEKIAASKPDLVIAASADGDRCSAWLTIDQLNLEKMGIPTVTITTNVFAHIVESTMKAQGVSEMAVVAVEHPIAGRNEEETRKLVEAIFPDILKTVTAWQTGKAK
jgi:ABC-type Fe3+-hydroxamate transport system substrate-binding protein